MHVVLRRGLLLLHMSHVAWSVCVCVSVLGTRVSCAKTAEPIEMPFGGLTHAVRIPDRPLQGGILRWTCADTL